LQLFRAVFSSASLSRMVGKLVSIRLPFPLSYLIIKTYCFLYKVDTSEAEFPIKAYRSLGEFFTRRLGPGLRPVEKSELLSPVDGMLRGAGGIIEGGLVEQVKGNNYSLESLLNDPLSAARYRSGYFFNFYLGPRDYHHVHSPVEGRVSRISYIPGRLLPVNLWTATNVKDLYPQNERAIVYIETQKGIVALVMVGALNVGKITLEIKPDFFSNYSLLRTGFDLQIEEPIHINRGALVGTFHMGSAVVLLLPSEFSLVEDRMIAPRPVRYGCELYPL